MTTWRSKINNAPDPEEETYGERVDEVMSEPWVLALEGLIRWGGVWVGSEEQLVQELKRRAGREVSASPDFPDSLQRLDGYQSVAIDGFCSRGFGVLDYRDLAEEDLRTSTCPGGGRRRRPWSTGATPPTARTSGWRSSGS
jgi:hypothetical protein